MIFVLMLPRQIAKLFARCSPKNTHRAPTNHSRCCWASNCLRAKSSPPRTCRNRESQCIDSIAKNIRFVSRLWSVYGRNITLFCDNACAFQHLLGIFTARKRLFYHFLTFLFPVFFHYYLHNSSDFMMQKYIFFLKRQGFVKDIYVRLLILHFTSLAGTPTAVQCPGMGLVTTVNAKTASPVKGASRNASLIERILHIGTAATTARARAKVADAASRPLGKPGTQRPPSHLPMPLPAAATPCRSAALGLPASLTTAPHG